MFNGFQFKPSQLSRPVWAGLLLVALAGLTATGFVFLQAHLMELARLQTRLQHDVEICAYQVEGEFRGCLVTTTALQQFLKDSEGRSRERFAFFVRPLLAVRQGIQALEWIPKVPHGIRTLQEESGQREGWPDFRIMEKNTTGQLIPAAERDCYFPVFLVEPLHGNEQAVGYDLGSDATRRASLELACERAEAIATAPIKLVQEKGNQAGFLLYAPIYRQGLSTDTAEQRRTALEGFALGVFRVGDLMRTALGPDPEPGLALALLDDTTDAGRLFYYRQPATTTTPEAGRAILYPVAPQGHARFVFAGRDWALTATAEPAYVAQYYSRAHWFVLPLGVLLTGLLLYSAGWLICRYLWLKADVQQRADDVDRREQHLALQSALTPLGYIEWDTAFRVKRWTGTDQRIFGYTAAEALGRHAAFIIPPAVQPAVDQIWQHLLAQAGGTRSTNENITKNGQTIVCDWYNLPQTDEEGRVIGVISFIEDITARRRAADAVAATERKYHTLFEAMSEGILCQDGTGRITAANPAAMRLLGCSPEELTGKWLRGLPWKYVGADGLDLPGEPNPIAVAATAGGTSSYCIMGLKHPETQAIRWLQMSVTPAFRPGETIPFETITTLVDITERQQAATELERKAAHIQSLNEILRTLQAVSRLIRQEKTVPGLLAGLCQTLVQIRSYRAVWIGQPEAGVHRMVPVARAGADTEVLNHILVAWCESPSGCSSCGAALREQRVAVINDLPAEPSFAPWRIPLAALRVKSLVVLPLFFEQTLYGVIMVMADQPNAFGAEEITLLGGLAQDVAQALRAAEDETALNTARAALQSSVEESQLMLATSVDGFSIADASGRFLDVNAAYCAMIGFSREEMLRMTVQDIQPQAQPEELQQRIEQVKAAGSTHFETRHRRKDGSSLEVEVSVTYVPHADGRLYAFVHDISSRKAAEQAQRRYQLMMQLARDVVLLISLDGRLVEANEAALRFYGYTRDELLDLRIFDLRKQEAPEVVRRQMELARQQGILFETEHRRKDGQWVPVEVSSQSVRVDGEELLMSIIRDISERKQVQKELWESEERFRALVEKAADCFLITDRSGDIIYISPTITQMTGRQPAELLGRNLGEHMHPDQQATVRTLLGRIVAEPEKPVQMEVRVQHKDGSWRLLAGMCTNFLDHPAIQGIVINCQDVTMRDALERQLRQAQKMEAIGTLAGGIAHDFNNMLFAIIGFTTIIQRRTGKDAKTQADLEQILIASRRSTELVRQLLIFSREGEKELIPLSFTPLLKETGRLLRATLPATIEIRYDLRAKRDTVMADPVQMQQVIMNLAINAYHAMRASGGLLTLCTEEREQIQPPVAVKPAEVWLCFSITDTGCGIAPEIIGRLFDPFFTTKPVGEGTGLGLSVVHGIVAAASGFIEVESTLQKGSTFRIYLPLLTAPIAKMAHKQQAKSFRPGVGHILCVDDEVLLTSMLKNDLEAAGYRVTTFNDSTTALSVFRQQPTAFDLLLTDQTMPNMTGLQLIQQVRELTPHLPVVLLTGFDSEQVPREQCQQLGLQVYHKPLEAEKLKEVLYAVLYPQNCPT